MRLKEKIRQLAEPLQKVVLSRALVAVVSLLLFVAVLIITAEFQFALPCLILAAYMIVNTAILLYNCVRNRYVVVNGDCTHIERTAIRKKIKSITIHVEDRVLVVHTKRRMRKIGAGDEITIYLSDKTPVFDQDGGYSIYDFYAIDVIRKV